MGRGGERPTGHSPRPLYGLVRWGWGWGWGGGGRLEGPVRLQLQGNYRTQKKSLTINRFLALPYGLGSLYMVNHCNRKKGTRPKNGAIAPEKFNRPRKKCAIKFGHRTYIKPNMSLCSAHFSEFFYDILFRKSHLVL